MTLARQAPGGGTVVERPTDEELEGLTGKQRRFIEEYCLSFNAKDAALRAGYSESQPAVQGYKNLRHPVIGREIRWQLSATADEMGITREWQLQKLRELVDMVMEPGRNWSPQAATSALAQVAKMRGDLIERVEAEVKVLAVQLNDVDMDDLR